MKKLLSKILVFIFVMLVVPIELLSITANAVISLYTYGISSDGGVIITGCDSIAFL